MINSTEEEVVYVKEIIRRKNTNARTEETIPDTGNAESSRGVGEKDSTGERSNRERISRRIKEILRKSTAKRNNNGFDRFDGRKTARIEHKETAEAFEERIITRRKINPTILYASRDKRAEFERDVISKFLEGIEDGERIDGNPKWNDWISNMGWLRQGNGVQNTVQRMGGGSNNRDAGVLQRQSRRKPSRAFRDVIENLFEISDRGRGGVEQGETP